MFLSKFHAVFENFVREISICFGRPSSFTSLDVEVSARASLFIIYGIFLLPHSFFCIKYIKPMEDFNPHSAAIIYRADPAQRFFISYQVAELCLQIVCSFFRILRIEKVDLFLFPGRAMASTIDHDQVRCPCICKPTGFHTYFFFSLLEVCRIRLLIFVKVFSLNSVTLCQVLYVDNISNCCWEIFKFFASRYLL